MKKSILSLVFAATAVVALASAAQAASIVASKHDLSTGGTAIKGTSNQTCVYCHTPHNGGSTGAPLWNKGASAATYTMYASGGTINMTLGTVPGNTSKACLVCHDGTLSVGVLTNLGGAGVTDTMTDQAGGATYTGGVMQAGSAFMLGSNLSNDHPIAITYDNTKDADFVTLAAAKTGGMVFFGAGTNEMECATCHDVHDPANGFFLRKSNAASALCTTCHVK
jgi:predicted CXXCH cytochrome family protein